MTIVKAFALIVASALICAFLGAGLGYAIGEFTPDVYRVMFSHPAAPEFSPVQLGIALGFCQGLVGGTFLGLVVIAILTWREVRLAQIQARPPAQDANR